MEWAATREQRPCGHLLLFFSLFLPAALARQSFLHPLFLTGLQVKGVTFHFLDDVFLLHLTLEAAQSIFEGFTLLNPDFRQPATPPNSSHLDGIVIARFYGQVKQYM